MTFLAKIFAPETQILRERLAIASDQQEWFKARLIEITAENEALRNELKTQSEFYRKIENELQNRLLLQAGMNGLKERTVSEIAEPDSDLPDEELEILQDRATDYCIQKYGQEFSKDIFDRVLTEMKANPAEWLTD